jgi:hypothetical protein
MTTFLTRDALAAKVKAGEPLMGVSLRSERVERLDGAVSDEQMEMVKAKLGADLVGRVVPFVISGEGRATDGHTIKAAGWDVAEYERVPHVFWQHDYRGWGMPNRGGVRVADSVLVKEAGRLSALAAFYPRDFSQALDGGFAWAVGELAALRGHRASVGFDIVEAAVASEDVRKTIPWALDISVARLREWSLVNFGADADAIVEGRAAGVDVAPVARGLERFLDEVAALTQVARADLEHAWAAAMDPGRPRVFDAAPAPASLDISAAVRAAWERSTGGQLPPV